VESVERVGVTAGGHFLDPTQVPIEADARRHDVGGGNIHTYADALWWSAVTVTTVGYGDKYPVSAAGRGVAVVLMLVGIGLMGVLAATVASDFLQRGADKEPGRALGPTPSDVTGSRFEALEDSRPL
jgi:voltage-gated potassium channel